MVLAALFVGGLHAINVERVRTMNHLVIAAAICLGLAVLLGSVDGLYFHLWKYRLFKWQESRFEHLLHTIRAFLFIPIVWLLFGKNYGGLWLWVGVTFAAGDAVIELIDVLVERRSRTNLGGLSTGEYAIHVNSTGLRLAALALIFAAKPVEAWGLTAPTLLDPPYPSWLSWLMLNMIPGSLVAALAHVWLMRSKFQVKNVR
jgi:hypothetical protein